MASYQEQLRQVLANRLSLEEVKNLYFALDIEAEDQTTISKDGLIRELLKRLDQRDALHKVEPWLAANRPDIDLTGLRKNRPNPQTGQPINADDNDNAKENPGCLFFKMTSGQTTIVVSLFAVVFAYASVLKPFLPAVNVEATKTAEFVVAPTLVPTHTPIPIEITRTRDEAMSAEDVCDELNPAEFFFSDAGLVYAGEGEESFFSAEFDQDVEDCALFIFDSSLAIASHPVLESDDGSIELFVKLLAPPSNIEESTLLLKPNSEGESPVFAVDIDEFGGVNMQVSDASLAFEGDSAIEIECWHQIGLSWENGRFVSGFVDGQSLEVNLEYDPNFGPRPDANFDILFGSPSLPVEMWRTTFYAQPLDAAGVESNYAEFYPRC